MDINQSTKPRLLTIAALIAGMAAGGLAPGAIPAALGQESGQDELIEEVVVTGSRRAPRSVGDSSAPIDVIGGDDFQNQGAHDMADLLRTLVPSYSVNTQPISDASTLIRPANLRGLPPDNTLVLLNGKRRHRSGLVVVNSGGVELSHGSHGPDVSVIPAIALKQVEVLRDGAAAQYGSDAIAGVINFVLKDNAEGFTIEGRYGQTYEGDGENYKISANLGLPWGDQGFVNLSFETSGVEATSRTIQRSDAEGLIRLGNTAVLDPAHIWGSPEIDDDYKFFFNLGRDFGDNNHAYAFGNYAEREVLGGFFFRNPNGRGGVFTRGSDRLIGDMTPGPIGQTNEGLADGDGIDCPTLTPSTNGRDFSTREDNPPTAEELAAGIATATTEQAALDAVIATPNCFVFNERHPGGFTPMFGGSVTDNSLVVGIRGETVNGVIWDLSTGYGSNELDFVIMNTLNASLGPDSPNDFKPGTFQQEEMSFNADFSYPVEIGLASPLNVGFGFEYREEKYEIGQGNEESWIAGPYFSQGFGVGSNGFSGFSPQVAGKWDRGNYASYLDLEVDVTEDLLLGLALRLEDFDDFGATGNGKVSARYAFADSFAARFTASTGFRAPTPGQANLTNVSTSFDATANNGAGRPDTTGHDPADQPRCRVKRRQTADRGNINQLQRRFRVGYHGRAQCDP